MTSSFTCIYYHIVFATKQRQPLLRDEIREHVCDYIGGILRAEHGLLIAAGGTADHLHLLTSHHKSHTIPDDVRAMKAGSSAWLKRTYPELATFAWQEGYGAFSLSYTGLDRVKAYIAGQYAHHRTVSFQEEFRAFLVQHHIAFDERYLWD